MNDENRSVDQFWLPEGYVVIETPRRLSRDSFEELEKVVELIMRRERRNVDAMEKEPTP